MIRQFKLWVCCVVVLSAVCLSASSVSAQGFGGGGGYGLGFYNYGNGSGIDQPRLPYYALYPPVYYSHVVPRPYGFSPFAYPPGVMTPEVGPAPGASTIINPFVPKAAPSNASMDKTADAGKMYYNPFVKQARPASEITVAGTEQR